MLVAVFPFLRIPGLTPANLQQRIMFVTIPDAETTVLHSCATLVSKANLLWAPSKNVSGKTQEVRGSHRASAVNQHQAHFTVDPISLALLPQAGLNLEDAVARMGLFGSEGARLWVTTGTEVLYAWDWAAALDEITEGALRSATLGTLRSMHSTCVMEGLLADSELYALLCNAVRQPLTKLQKASCGNRVEPASMSACMSDGQNLSSGGEGASLAVPDARDQLTGAACSSAFAQELGSGIDYLIGCQARITTASCSWMK